MRTGVRPITSNRHTGERGSSPVKLARGTPGRYTALPSESQKLFESQSLPRSVNRIDYDRGAWPPVRAHVSTQSTPVHLLANHNATLAATGSKTTKEKVKIIATMSKTGLKRITLAANASSAQGRRPTMEDVHSINLSISVPTAKEKTLAYAAVYDGHCGRHVAELVSTMLPALILSQKSFPDDTPTAITQAFVAADRAVFRKLKGIDGGSTCSAALIMGNELYIGNLGDARAVLVETQGKATPLSKDHKPNFPAERTRVQHAGGFVEFGRVGGCLAVSRAFGDFEFKGNNRILSDMHNPVVSNVPDVTKVNLTDSCEALILACDGLWDVVSNDEAAYTAFKYLQSSHTDREMSCKRASDALVQLALMKGTMDNVTAVVISLR
ncbi:hypothetical protein DIPPA_70120 [Diplonema papillatum]|nr:hypothetical protein DIPPA_70120 [Diplonema papillatum]